MKKYYLLLFTFFITGSLMAVNPVANPGFEIWSGTPLSPDNWTTFNSPGFVPITQVAGVSGFAARGEVVDFMGAPVGPFLEAGLTYNQWLDSVFFYYKTDLDSSDEFLAVIQIFDATSSLVAIGFFTDTNSSSVFIRGAFSIDSISTTTPPYNGTLRFLIGPGITSIDPHSGNSFVVDNVVVGSSNFPTAVNSIQRKNPIAELFPVPAKDFISIKLNSDEMKVDKVVIRNMLGQVFLSADGNLFDRGEARLNVEDLDAGIYFVELTSDKSVFTNKFVKKD